MVFTLQSAIKQKGKVIQLANHDSFIAEINSTKKEMYWFDKSLSVKNSATLYILLSVEKERCEFWVVHELCNLRKGGGPKTSEASEKSFLGLFRGYFIFPHFLYFFHFFIGFGNFRFFGRFDFFGFLFRF
jgi:hypothetical protein